MEKQCRQCQQIKPIVDFYPHKMMKDGHLNKCKSCVKVRIGTHRQKHLEEIREYDRIRANEAHRVKARTAYAKRYRKEHPTKQAAHNKVAKALRTGALVRQPCAVCQKKKTEAHHPDYAQPLNVVWLCSQHHKDAHRAQNLTSSSHG